MKLPMFRDKVVMEAADTAAKAARTGVAVVLGKVEVVTAHAAVAAAHSEVVVVLGLVEVVTVRTAVVVALAVEVGPCERAVDGLGLVEVVITMVVHDGAVTAYDAVADVPREVVDNCDGAGFSE